MSNNKGTVIQVMGPVLDIRFADDQLPQLLSAIEGANGDTTIVAEVAQHIGDNVVRCIAMGATDGLQRGTEAIDTGAAISVHAIADGQAEAVEFLVDKTTRNCGKPLKELKLKPDVLIASITHGAKSEVPNGNSLFCEGDSVVVVTSGRGVLQQLNDIFA